MSEFFGAQRVESQLLVILAIFRAAQYETQARTHIHSVFLCLLAVLCWRHHWATAFDILLGLTATLFGMSRSGVVLLGAVWMLNQLSKRGIKAISLRRAILIDAAAITIILGSLTSYQLARKSALILVEYSAALRLFNLNSEYGSLRRDEDERRFLISLPFVSLLFLACNVDQNDGYQLCAQYALHIFTLGVVLSKYIQHRTPHSRKARAYLFWLLWSGLFGSCIHFLFTRSVPSRSIFLYRHQAITLLQFVLLKLWNHLSILLFWAFAAPFCVWFGVSFVIRRPVGGKQIRSMRDKHRYILGRKYFHLVIFILTLPMLFLVELQFAAIVWIVVLSFYAFLETLRACEVTSFNAWIQKNIVPYADERDQDGFIVTPLMLILGTCFSIIMEFALQSTNLGQVYDRRLMSSIGLAAACVADGVAAIAGTWCKSPHYLPGAINGKTWEGSVSFFLSYVIMLMSMSLLTKEDVRWTATIISGIVATIFEGYTDYIDNFLVSTVAYVTYHIAIA